MITMKKKIVLILSIFMAALLVLGACSNNNTAAPNQPSPQPSNTQTGGMQTNNNSGNESDSSEVDFPTKPIKLIVYSNTGGGIDLITRQLSKSLAEVDAFPVTTYVENMPGAGGTVAMEHLAKIEPDGYEIMVASNSLTTQPILLNFDKNVLDFKPIINLGVEALFVTVRTDSGFDSLEDIINHEGVITVGGPTKGSLDHITWMRLAEASGLKLNYVPYKSGGDAVTALVGGDTQVMFTNAAESKALIEAGRIKMLASTGRERYDYPEIPTLLDLGYDITQEQFRGFITNKDVPDKIVQILHDGIKKAYDNSDSMKEYLKSNSISPGYMNGEDYKRYLTEEVEKMEKYLKELGIVE